MQELTEVQYETNDQYKDVFVSRMSRDATDIEKIMDKLESYTPFSQESSLRNIITGVNANKDVNVHDLFTEGYRIVKDMKGKTVFNFSYKRKWKVKTLASSKSVLVANDTTLDPSLLFQRFIMVSQTGDINLAEVMSYELSSYPLSLFEGKHILRKADKPQLADSIKHMVSSNSAMALPNVVKETEHYVLDGGSLLHRMKWVDGSTYGSIANQASSFVIKHYGKATVVFDGHEGPSIKDCTHQRRGKTSHYADVDVTEQRKFVGKKDAFLQNTHNKQQIIRLITEELQRRECQVIQAEDDADVEIAKAAVSMAQFKSTTVIGEDTDLLVLLLYYTNIDNCSELERL